MEVLEEWGLEETPGVVTNAQGGPRPWSGLPGRTAVLGFPSLSLGLMEVLVSLLYPFFFFFLLFLCVCLFLRDIEGEKKGEERRRKEGRGWKEMEEDRRGQERRGEPLCALVSPFVHSEPL